MNNKEIPHNQISPKIKSESRTNICKYWIPLTYKDITTYTPGWARD